MSGSIQDSKGLGAQQEWYESPTENNTNIGLVIPTELSELGHLAINLVKVLYIENIIPILYEFLPYNSNTKLTLY